MRKRKPIVGRQEDSSFSPPPIQKPRLSLEQKILRYLRRYRAAEKRRLKKESKSGKRHSRIRYLQKEERNPEIGGEPAKAFERAARVCSANTLAKKPSAAKVRTAPRIVAGRFLLPGGPASSDMTGCNPVGQRLITLLTQD